MNSPFEVTTNILFIFISMLVLLIAAFGMRALALAMGESYSAARRKALATAAVILGWLLMTGILAIFGFFRDFVNLPPRVVLAIVPAMIVITYYSFFSKFMKRALKIAPSSWFIFPQTFRLFVEIGLWMLYLLHEISVVMTFEGRNFDVAIGLSAPIIAWLCFRSATSPKRTLALIWNFFGIAVLLNVVIHGILSTPNVGLILTDPPNTIVAYFPIIWLPTFLVPMAFLFHFLSIKNLILQGRK